MKKLNILKKTAFFGAITILSTTLMFAEGKGDHDHSKHDHGDAKKIVKETEVKTYILDTCPVSGEPLGSMGKPIIQKYKVQIYDKDEKKMVTETRVAQLCCKGCIKKFKKNQAKYVKKIDAMVAEKIKAYGSDTCIVSGEKLTDMGMPVSYTHTMPNGSKREMLLCCKGCVRDFKKNPSEFIPKLPKK